MYIGIPVTPSKAVSYVLGAAVGFIINKLWTFESRTFLTMEIVKYIILYAFSAMVNALINRTVLDWLDISIIAFLAATGTSTIINYLGQKFFVFSKRGDSC